MPIDNSLRIRPAVENDMPLIVSLVNALADYEKLEGPDAAAVERLRKHGFGEPCYFKVLLAEIDGRAAGYAFYFFTYSTFLAKPTLYLEDLFVLPEYRKRGVGYLLMKELAKIAVNEDCGRLDWAVLDWNQNAIDFYNRLGAVQLNDWIVCRLTGEPLTNLAKE
ncbi:MAG TPA: GNAT family N-acetyltransferase [Blastocatellia bacterium]|nr:GNAT family N-acetyltransferase [Blastocatellia bacterium]